LKNSFDHKGENKGI